MKKISDDLDLREEVKRKCKNDWNLDLSEDQVTSCLVKMEKTKLSIFHGQIWPNTRSVKVGRDNWEKRTTWAISIDGYRAIAHRNGLAGIEEPSFITDDSGKPVQASIRVYRIHNGVRSTYVGSARYSEFVQLMDEYDEKRKKTGRQIPNHQWQKSPFNQLAMAAERQALRRGFQETIFDDEGTEVYDPVPSEIEDANEISTGEDFDAPASVDARVSQEDAAPPPAPTEPDDLGDEKSMIKDKLRPLLDAYRAKHDPDAKLTKKYIRKVCRDLLGLVIDKGQELELNDLRTLHDALKDEVSG
jgi:hypothetical protein